MIQHPLVSSPHLVARGARRATVLLCLTAAATALAQAPRAAAVAAQTARTQIHGCVIDADDYSARRSLPIRVFLQDGTALATVQTDASGRFISAVPEGASISLMTPSGTRSAHSTAWLTARGADVQVAGCLLHFN